MSEGLEVMRPGGGSGGMKLWRRVTAAESGWSARTSGPPNRSAPPLPLGTSDPSSANPSRIELDGSQYVLLRTFFRLAAAAVKTCRLDIIGYHGDGKQPGLSLYTGDFSTSLDSVALAYDPLTGAALAAGTSWFETQAVATAYGMSQLAVASQVSTAFQTLTYLSTIDCTILVPRWTSLEAGVSEVLLLGMPAGQPRSSDTTAL